MSEARPTPVPTVPVRVVAGLLLASLAMRPEILAIGPLLPFIREDLDVPAAVAGLLTTIPVLCMGLFAPIGPRLAARVGPRIGLAACLTAIVGGGVLRAAAPDVPLLLLATLVIGIGIGSAGAIPSMVVAQRLPTRPALGTGAYAGGIVTGSAIAAAVAVPLAGPGHDWRQALSVLSAALVGSLVAWLLLVRGPDHAPGGSRPPALRLPWRDRTAWLLVVVFGLQSVLYYGVVAWLPNTYVERGWSPADAGGLLAACNAIGLLTTFGVPLVADRLGARRPQLLIASAASTIGMLGIVAAPEPALLWVAFLGLGLGTVFPLALTLPIDVADDPQAVGSVAALMLLGGYAMSSIGPVVMGAVRDATGRFDTSLWLMVAVGVALIAGCARLSPERLRRGVTRATP